VEKEMKRRSTILIFACLVVGFALPLLAQQKGQWVPGQYGLNAGVIPDPGFTYLNMAINYSAGQLNDFNGNARPNIVGTYSFWVDENIFMYVPKYKILGGYFAPYAAVNVANGSLVADIRGTNLGANGGGSGLADTFVAPVNMAWHFKRADFNAGYAFVAPTGRFTPLANNNVGSGYWGNNFTTGTTYYITKNKGTSANLFTDWEFHGKKSGINITPGQAFTMEWGLGQILPLKKDFSRLLQVGLIGYDQWQVSSNGGLTRSFPFYSSHAIGFQTNFIMPAKGLSLFFKFEDAYRALATTKGRTIVFGGAWTLRIPKPVPPKT
jgi:hypothetical protein